MSNIANNLPTIIGGNLNGSFKELKDINLSIQNIINNYDGIVLIRERIIEGTLKPFVDSDGNNANRGGGRTIGTFWYKGQILGFTVEDFVRNKKIYGATAIPDTIPNNALFDIETLSPNSYNLTLDTTGKESLKKFYVKFPQDKRSIFRSPGVFPRIGTDVTAVNLKKDSIVFDGIRIHGGKSEDNSYGCIIFSRTRNADGTLVSDLDGCHLLTKWIYNNQKFIEGKKISKLMVLNEFEISKSSESNKVTLKVVNSQTNKDIPNVTVKSN